MAFSDVVSPLPMQPDTGNLGGTTTTTRSRIATSHRTAWMDGHVPIIGMYQPMPSPIGSW